MQPVSIFLNILWLLLGGVYMAAGWVIAAIIMAITIIGLPWARAAFNIAVYTLLPFGQTAVSRADYTGREDLGTGPFGTLGNIIWFIFAGWWLGGGPLLFFGGGAPPPLTPPFCRIAKMIVPMEKARRGRYSRYAG